MGAVSTPTSVYNLFRENIDCDLFESGRLQYNGMCELLRAVLSHCYRAAAVAAPHAVQDACLQLVKHNTSFIKQQHKDA